MAISKTENGHKKNKKIKKTGAEDGTRTQNTNLKKVLPHQLRYFRIIIII